MRVKFKGTSSDGWAFLLYVKKFHELVSGEWEPFYKVKFLCFEFRIYTYTE